MGRQYFCKGAKTSGWDMSTVWIAHRLSEAEEVKGTAVMEVRVREEKSEYDPAEDIFPLFLLALTTLTTLLDRWRNEWPAPAILAEL
jgi:hypothetical protein